MKPRHQLSSLGYLVLLIMLCGTHLFFGLCLLHHLSTHFDFGSEDGTGEVCQVDALQVTHFLGSCAIIRGE